MDTSPRVRSRNKQFRDLMRRCIAQVQLPMQWAVQWPHVLTSIHISKQLGRSKALSDLYKTYNQDYLHRRTTSTSVHQTVPMPGIELAAPVVAAVRVLHQVDDTVTNKNQDKWVLAKKLIYSSKVDLQHTTRRQLGLRAVQMAWSGELESINRRNEKNSPAKIVVTQ